MGGSKVADPRVDVFHEFLHPRDAITAMVLVIAAVSVPVCLGLLWGCRLIEP